MSDLAYDFMNSAYVTRRKLLYGYFVSIVLDKSARETAKFKSRNASKPSENIDWNQCFH